MNKTDLWDKLGKTDPAHTKQFTRAGGFKGTAIKPMWSYRRMTEEFGPCGTGWGINEPTFQVVPAGETILVYCTASVWYDKADQIVFGVGGDMVAGKRGNYAVVDDEAFKKAYTDAVTNALKMIGVGADVHMGMFDDNKYVNTVAGEFEEKAKSSASLKKENAWDKAMADLEEDALDADSESKLSTLHDVYRARATVEQWTPAWKASLEDVFLKQKSELHERNLWAELEAITSLQGLKTFWEDNSADIKILGPNTLQKFSKKKDDMKLQFEARNHPMNGG